MTDFVAPQGDIDAFKKSQEGGGFVAPQKDVNLRRLEDFKEGVKDYARPVVSGLSTGLSELLGAPAALFNLAGSADKAILKKLGYEHNPVVAPDVTGFLQEKSSDLTEGYTDYEPTTRTGRVVKNVSRFLPAAAGAIMTGGLSAPAALGYAAVTPGVTGALAKEVGDYLGGERAGNIAQAVTETLSPLGASRIGNALSKMPGEVATVADDIKRLESFMGTKVTPGSIQSNPDARNAAIISEASNPRKLAAIKAQGVNFSKKILEGFGIDNNLAIKYGFRGGISPENASRVVGKHKESVGKEIGSVYDSLTPKPLMIEDAGGLKPPVTTGMPAESNKFLDALTGSRGKETLSLEEIKAIRDEIDFYRYELEEYADNPEQQGRIQSLLDQAIDRLNNAQTPPISGGLVPQLAQNNAIDLSMVSKLVEDFPGMAKYSPDTPIGDYIRNIRTEAGQIISGEHGTLGTSYAGKAKALINYIDSTVKDAIGSDEFARLQSLNEEYSKLSTVEGALGKAASEGRAGILTPQDIIGAKNTRYTLEMQNAAKLADIYLLRRNLIPTPENKRHFTQVILNALAAGAAGASQLAMMGFNPTSGLIAVNPTSGLIAAGTAAAGGFGVDLAQKAIRAAKNSRVYESAERARALHQPVNPIDITAGPAATAAMSGDRQERKSGGRVGSHEAEADRLVMAAERAKRGLSAHTEGLLNTSDDAVASALEIANRSI